MDDEILINTPENVKFESFCQICGKPYIYYPPGGCMPDKCQNAPAKITEGEWAELKMRVNKLEEK